ncbi:MAG: hypothetical protein A2167_00885 [Planctomycetes bacterium RBG_13_46_10]|nr:MAG: hypothetical protein A2167_00885 [Planctomycetes bacterium RBG_13_46_10]
MKEMISFCGLTCHKCPIYLVTREKDSKKQRQIRAEIAQKINEIYKEKMKAEDITDCDGCKAEGARLFSGCKKCEIRKCAKGKAIENCAYCNEYPCGKLEKFFATDTEAKARLDVIRSRLI